VADPAAVPAEDPRRVLAGFENTWLHRHETAAAKRIAESGSDEECVAELERLRRRCKSRLEQWRWSQ
jgi:hypothetical protein